MAYGHSDPLLRHIRRLAGLPDDGGRTDHDLLEEFHSGHGERAFTALVRRHGPMVLGVCRRVLRHEQDAEDAFQATFLVLARKAAALPGRASVGPWLYEVARRTAQKAKANRARRGVHERLGEIEMEAETDVLSEADAREVRRVLDEELGRLPAKYRAPVVLCYLEGKSLAEAGRLLGWARGTVAGRLARARAVLRVRLSRRGLALSAAAVAAVLSREATAGGLPGMLVHPTVKAMLLAAAGKAVVGGAVSVPAVTLAHGVLRAMLLTKLKVAVGVFVVCGALATGAGVLTHHALAEKQAAEGQANAPEPAAEVADLPKPKPTEDNVVRTDRYGDPLPDGAIARLGTVRFRHSFIIYNIAFSPDGRQVAAVNQMGSRCLWDPATGKMIRPLEDQFSGLSRCLAYSPDGKLLASDESQIGIWEVATGRKLRELEIRHRGRLTSLAFSPDGKVLAAGTDGDPIIGLYEVATGKLGRRLVGHTGAARSAVFSQDGRWIASAGQDRTARIWDYATGKEVTQFQDQEELEDVAWSPDGKRLAIRTRQAVSLWDIAASKRIYRIAYPGNDIRSLAFSPDGKFLLSGDKVWESATGNNVATLEGSLSGCLAFAPDGKTLAAGGYQGLILLYDTTTWKVLPHVRATRFAGPVQVVGFLPGGKSLIVHDQKGAQVWETATGKELFDLRLQGDHPRAFALAPDGKTLGTVGVHGTITLWDASTGRQRHKLRQVRPGEGNRGLLPAVAFAPDSRTVASAGLEDDIRLWEVDTGKELLRLKGHSGGIYSLIFSPDGKTLISTSLDQTTRLWDTAQGWEKYPRRKQRGWVRGVSPDGRLFALSHVEDRDSSIRIQESATGKELRRLEGIENRNHCTFSSDGKTLAVGDTTTNADDGLPYPTVHLIEITTGKIRAAFTGHRAYLERMAFSADDRTLASGSWDTTALLWDVTGRKFTLPPAPARLSAPELAGRWAALAGEDARQAYRAIWTFVDYPEQSLPFLGERLRAAPLPDGPRIARLITDLDDSRFAVREKATQELERLGEVAKPALRKAREEKPPVEVARRIDLLLDKLGVPTGERLRQLRAVEILEHVGTSEARRLLEVLAAGVPAADLTQEAKASLERLARRSVFSP
jgi:RNA polymerase sigma factor (sigma-70 family)